MVSIGRSENKNYIKLEHKPGKENIIHKNHDSFAKLIKARGEFALIAAGEVLKDKQINSFISGNKKIDKKTINNIDKRAKTLQEKHREQLTKKPKKDEAREHVGVLRKSLSKEEVDEGLTSSEVHSLITDEMRGLTPEEEYYQIMANKVAYADWNIGDVIEDPSYEGGEYKVKDVIKNDKGLQIVVLVPVIETDPPDPPIFACRGTLNMPNVVDDLGKVIGKSGLTPSLDRVEEQFGTLTERYGSAVICGHSLGGAIAQILTAKYCDRSTEDGQPWIKKCLHFNSPGCGKKTAKEYATKKKELLDPPEVIAWHQGKDVVYKAGGPHLEADKELIVIKKWKKNVVKQILAAHSDLSIKEQRTDQHRMKVRGPHKEKRVLAVGVEGVRDSVRNVASLGIKTMAVTPHDRAIERTDKLRTFIAMET